MMPIVQAAIFSSDRSIFSLGCSKFREVLWVADKVNVSGPERGTDHASPGTKQPSRHQRRPPAREAHNLLNSTALFRMNSTLSSPAPATAIERPRIDWFAVSVFALLWLEVVSRLRFEWTINPQYGYGWTVPFLAAYVFWRRREHAPAPGNPRSKIFPIAIAIIAATSLIPVRLIQEANPDWRMLSWAMALSAVAISACAVYLAGGIRWLRHFSFPLLFFLVAVPWPMQFEQLIIQGLMRVDALINVEVLNAIGIPAVQLGNVIEVGSGFVGIDEACTGIRSLQATFMVSLFLGEFYGFTPLRRAILVVAGAVLAFVCNLIRTFLLVYVGAEHGSAAIKSWHDPAGHTILMACLLGLWGLSIFLRARTSEPLVRRSTPVSALPIPAFLLIAILGLTLVAEAGTQVWYIAHERRTARVDPWAVAWPTQARNWKSVPVAESAQDLLRYNEGGGGAWKTEDGHEWLMYFFRWLPGRTAALFIKNHRPDICLPASGMQLRGGAQNRLFLVNGIPLPIRSYVFENRGQSLHVYYCYWDGSLPQNDANDQENWTAAGRLDNVRRGKRDIGTQMLEIAAGGYADDAAAEEAVRNELAKIIQPR